MSEHDSHNDPALSDLYRRMAQEEPSAQLDDRVMAAARRHVSRRSHRWWLPLSSAAVLVLTVSLLLRHQQEPDMVQQQVAELEAAPQAKAPEQVPADTVTAAAPSPIAPRKEARTAAKPEAKAKAVPQAAEGEPPLAEPARSAPPPAEIAAAPAAPAAPAPAKALAAVPAADMAEKKAETQQAEAAGAMARSKIADEQKREAVEAPALWLKRIEALRAKGELEAAKRELTAFRKAYPGYTLPKELQALLPESAK